MQQEHHPLSDVHFKKIIRRNQKTWDSLVPVWGISWNLRGRSLFNLGTASMLAMSYHPTDRPDSKGMIEMLCVGAETNPDDGSIHYSNIRMAHDFSRNPRPGARDRVLDPREEGSAVRRGDRPNASWVRLGLEVDRMVCRAATQNWRLGVVPVLPKFMAGFPNMSSIDMEITPALLRDIAAHMGRPVEYLQQLDAAALSALATAHWPELWVAPGANGNDTGLWLINTAYTTQLCKSARLFEDFSGMMGVEVWNPARDVVSANHRNPARDCAAEQGIELDALLDIVARGGDEADVEAGEVIDPMYSIREFHEGEATGPMTPTQFNCTYDEAVDQLFYLRTCMRGSLGMLSSKFTDDEVNFAVMNPDSSMLMQLTDPLKELGEDAALVAVRQQLQQTRPLVSVGTTDADLLEALAKPQSPLYASRMCEVQVLRRDVRTAPEDAFNFTPATLERDRVYAHLWAGAGWTPRAARSEKYANQRKLEHATAE